MGEQAFPEAHAASLRGMQVPRERPMGGELAGQPVGIVGLGHIGTCSTYDEAALTVGGVPARCRNPDSAARLRRRPAGCA